MGNKGDAAFKARFSQVIAKVGGLRKAAEIAESTEDQVARWRDGAARPAFFPVLKICREAGVSPEWLGTGSEPTPPPPPTDDIILIPVLDVRVAAGAGAWNERAHEVDRVPFSAEFFRARGIDPDWVHGVRPGGDSMLPTIAPEALCLINTRERDLTGDGIWVFVLDDVARVKRVQRGFDGSLTLLSDNSKLYQPERVERHELHSLEVVGRIFWCEQDL